MATAAPVHLSLNSSIDIQGTITKLLSVETSKITKVQEKQTALLADVSAWGDVSSSLTSLSDSLYTLKDWKTWNTMAVTSSNTAQFTGSATSSAVDATYSIAITRIAKAHSVASSKASDLGLSGVTDTLVGKVAGLTAGDQFKIGGADGQVITIEASDTISTLRDKINTASSSLVAGDKVFASILDNRLVITRSSTGSTAIDIANEGAGTPLDDLGVMTGVAFNNELVAAQDALFSVNGASVTRSTNTNLTDVIEGVSLNLLDATTSTQRLTVARDADVVKAAIDAFVTDYNAAVKKLEDYTTVDLSNPKAPATAELQADTMAAPILYNLRKILGQDKQPYMDSTNASYTYDGRDGIMSSLSSIGVWTEGRENSIAVTDPDRLDSMLANNFEKVEQLMRGIYTEGSGYQHGVATDLYTYTDGLSQSLTGEISKHIAVIQNQSNRIGEDVDKMLANLSSYEQTLWTQFDAMDQAMSNMTAQIAYISNTLGKG